MTSQDYESLYEDIKEIGAVLERRNNPHDIKLLNFLDYFTSSGVRFPNKESEAELRRYISYPPHSSDAKIASTYFLALKRALTKTEAFQRVKKESKLGNETIY
ncbi:MAG: hypothetical protein QXS38_00940 [Candidatus Pacearchaeota archaeon]